MTASFPWILALIFSTSFKFVSLMKFSPTNASLKDLAIIVLRDPAPADVAQIALGDEDTSEMPVPYMLAARCRNP